MQPPPRSDDRLFARHAVPQPPETREEYEHDDGAHHHADDVGQQHPQHVGPAQLVRVGAAAALAGAGASASDAKVDLGDGLVSQEGVN